MKKRLATLFSPGFPRRDIPRDDILGPPPRRWRRWLWRCVMLFVLITAGLLLQAVAEPSLRPPGLVLAGDDPVDAIHLETRVDIRVTGLIARVEVTQRFRNQTMDWREAVYVMPLPDGAAVHFAEIRIQDRRITAQIREREQAKRIYESAKREGRVTSLTEKERANLFTQSVANIPPGEVVSVVTRFDTLVDFDGAEYRLQLPTTLTRRYLPDSVADATRVSPPYSPDVRHEATFAVTLDVGGAVAGVGSPSHDIQVLAGRNDALVRVSAARVALDRDFRLHWRPVPSSLPGVAVFGERIDGHDYALVMVTPPSAEPETGLPREVVFIVDSSGSMKGEPMRHAKHGLSHAIMTRLGTEDRFNVIDFDSSYSALFPQSQLARPGTRARAVDFVEGLDADGGTEMAGPLEAALTAPPIPGYLRHVVFVTDGAVGNESELFELIHSRLGDARLFTVGIGSAPNSFFMRKAAAFGRGSHTRVARSDEVVARLGELFDDIRMPLAADVAIEFRGSAGVERYPDRLPALYTGKPLVLLARAEFLQGDVEVRGTVNGVPWIRRVPVEVREVTGGVGSAWARHKIEALLDRKRMGADPERIRGEVTDVALTHQLMSPYTSLVAVEHFASRRPGESLASARVANAVPAGQVVSMPQTATPARLLAMIGGLAMLVAVLMSAGGHLCGRRQS